ncbi:MAG: AAA family ATPase [Candidatus Dormibacteraeota bacterium]|nr:AAA family ATPase [Candidatus Dormibacteraeota bacterium]
MREQRKVVTVLFADVVGSTALADATDPEVVRARMARHFQRIAEVSEAHGGTVEKFAGDAAMVVFGVPAVHDDDAERAVRAALEIRDGATDLPVRVGVNTGEAVTAPREDRQFMVSGDAVNVAARLQQGAEPGEVVVGPLTQQLTRNVIEYAPRDPVSAKGKSEPLVAFRAVRPRSQVPEQARGVEGLQAALVGRDRELRLLLDTFARTASDRRPHLFTLVGSAGVGKSRLVSEALATLANSGARLLRGRCLPYGRGVTYWPIIEMLRPDTGITRADEHGAALAKLDRWLGELLAGDAQLPAIRARLAVMLGLLPPSIGMPDTAAERVDKEIGWGIRHYLDAVARGGPLILVVDDLQWAEPPVVETFEQLAERSSDVPMMLICIARPEFLEGRRDWAAGKPNSTTITLDPLTRDETGTLISRLLEIEALPADLRGEIIERSAGTPLFCEEFIQMLIDEGRLIRDGASWRATGPMREIRVPHSIQAVLAARLDSLPDGEKSILQAASIVGERFEVSQIEDMTGGADPENGLESLRRKGLVTGGDGTDEMSFRHILIRDAAYASLPKSERAALHDRFGITLEREAGDPQPLTEILGHHAERALTISVELGIDGDLLEHRARRALDWSLASADRASTRRDLTTLDAALHNARDAVAHMPDGGGLESRARLALLEAERLVITADYPAAARATAAAADLAEEAGLPAVVAKARLSEAWIANWAGMQEIDEFDRTVERAVDACRKAGDIAGEIEARHIGTNHQWALGRLGEFIEINEGLLAQARSIGDSAHAAAILVRLAPAYGMLGDQPAAERVLAEAESLATTLGFRNIGLGALMQRANRSTVMGDLDASERVHREFLAAAADEGAVQYHVAALRHLARVLLYQHRADEAATALDRAIELSETTGERWNRSEILGLRARAALLTGDLDAAEGFISRALSSLRGNDVTAISEVQNHLGMIRAAQGRQPEAEEAQRRSLDAIAQTDYNWLKTQPTLALAGLLAERGAVAEAMPLFEERVRWVREQKTHLWDAQIDELRSMIAAKTGV